MKNNIIYYKEHEDYNSYIEFYIENLVISDSLIEKYSSLRDLSDYLLDNIVLEYIAKYGGSIEFPKELLESFDNDLEIDLFLLSAYDKQAKKSLKERLFILLPPNLVQKYHNTLDNESFMVKAVGSKSMIIDKSLDTGLIVLENFVFNDLDSSIVAL